MIYNADLIPRAQDAGLDSVLESLSYETIDDMQLFLTAVNSQTNPLRITEGPLLQYLADRHLAWALLDVAYDGELPQAIARIDAPTGIGYDNDGVWFGLPDTGMAFVRWYVNGAIKRREERDLSSNRYITLAELDNPLPGDVVQIAIEGPANTVGWWGRAML